MDINHPQLSNEKIIYYEEKLREIINDFDGPHYDPAEEPYERKGGKNRNRAENLIHKGMHTTEEL